jgi:hypothetical protein
MKLTITQHTMSRTALHLKLFVFLLTAFFLNPRSTLAFGTAEGTLPTFADFRQSVQDGSASQLRGVYVPNILALPVVQQPAEDPYYVSNRSGEVTEFSVASHYGNIGLLAHNTLSGRFFFNLAVGQEVRLVYGDGQVEYFMIQQILQFQALQPKSVSSSFRNLDRDEIISASEVFNRAYAGEHHLVFQTCIEANGNPSWGRLFIIAVPKH